jgi:uncharacterized membrane protein YgaE (UPF0421/DUF939 family)
MATDQALGLRAALVIGLASALSYAVCGGLKLGGEPAAFAAVVAALVVRPDFSRWPLALYAVLPLAVALSMGIGVSIGLALADMPQLLVFGFVAALMQLLALVLPAKLRILSGAIACTGVLPLLGTPSWSSWAQELVGIGLGLAIGTALQIALTPPRLNRAAAQPEPTAPESEDPPLAQRLQAGLHSPFFWRKLVFASLGLAIGEGLGAVTPKYVYFGVVLLLNDSIGATLARVRDRMAGVSLGVLMPLLVFNTLGMGDLSVGLVMGGTAALLTALRFDQYLNTALISSGVAFIGYGPLVAWYIPNRWLDYLLGSGLALAVGLLLFPNSALRRFNRLEASGAAGNAERLKLLPAAREEARWLGLPAPQLPAGQRPLP